MCKSIITGEVFVVTHIGQTLFTGFFSDGSSIRIEPAKVKKLGKRIDVNELLKKIGENE